VRLSRESRYAILALEELMSHDDDEIVDARSLARPAKLPEHSSRRSWRCS
jgi:DNA-binding IscR family transcriptional regulator